MLSVYAVAIYSVRQIHREVGAVTNRSLRVFYFNHRRTLEQL